MSGAVRTAREIAADVRAGRTSARDVTEQALRRIALTDGAINAFTRVLRERALEDAAKVDDKRRAGIDPGPLAGVPFAVKDLFDVAGLSTTAGAKSRRGVPPAEQDAEAVRRLCDAGAVLVGTLNMDEFAYGFATVNAHWGTTRNPHDHDRLAGGSSGGSAAAVAAAMVPVALGSDTNGSVRVPAALCGVYGFRPTHGDLPIEGVFPFAESFDDIGAFATDIGDLALVRDVLRGGPAEIAAGVPRVARLDGWFRDNACADVLAGVDAVVGHFGPLTGVTLPEVQRARAAAFLMTAAEGGALHLPALRTDALAFDPETCDRLIAGALIPKSIYRDAQRFRGWFANRVAALFEQVDVLVAPTCMDVAPRIDDPTVIVDGQPQAARANLGLYTQPLSFVGLPVVAAPLRRAGLLPLGVQLIAALGREPALFAAAAAIEQAGLTGWTSTMR